MNYTTTTEFFTDIASSTLYMLENIGTSYFFLLVGGLVAIISVGVIIISILKSANYIFKR